MITDPERCFFLLWWQSFGTAPVTVSGILTYGSEELINAAAAIAPQLSPYLGKVSPSKLGRWLSKQANSYIHIDDSTIVGLVKQEAAGTPGACWRLRPKEEMAEAA
jgi:hypothetical protein